MNIDNIDLSKIKFYLVFCTLFFLLPKSTNAQVNPDTISFLHISDIHFCNLDSYHPSFIKSRQHYGGAAEPLLNFFKTTPEKIHSDFIVATGDMIDYYEASTPSGRMMDTQVEQFVKYLNACNVPVYMTLGNHDIASYWVDEESRNHYHQHNSMEARATWIRNAACFRGGTYYSRVFQVGETTYRLIFLDNGYYSPEKREAGAAPNIIDEYQLLWLDDQLKKSDTDVEIIFMHIPLITPDKGDLQSSVNKYFLDMSDTLAIPYKPKNQAKNTFDLWSVLEKNASAQVIFCGHHHSSVNNKVQISNDYSINQIMTGSFGRDIRNWRLVQLTSDKIIISFPGINKVQYSISIL